MVAANPPIGPGSVTSRRTSFAAPWRHVDMTLIAAVISIAGIGVLLVYSATNRKLAAQGIDPHYYLKRQVMFVALGLAAMIVTSAVDYRTYRDFAPLLYGGTVLLLAAVISPLGASSKGHQAWFPLGSFQLQPSEMAKIGWWSAWPPTSASNGTARWGFGACSPFSSWPGSRWGSSCCSPTSARIWCSAAILVAVLLVGRRQAAAPCGARHRGHRRRDRRDPLRRLQQYQVDRLTAFLDQSHDTQGTRTTCSSPRSPSGRAGLLGKGLVRGTQTNLSYVPEQHTDFIFTAVGEQLGLVGSALLLLLFGFVVWRIWRAAILARDLTGTLICVGVLAMLVFQVFENVGMTMGIMPIAGIPLPFMSYGGSAMLAYFVGIGLVLNVHMRRFS